MTTLEVFDGYASRWGFSWSDMGFNLLGSGMFDSAPQVGRPLLSLLGSLCFAAARPPRPQAAGAL